MEGGFRSDQLRSFVSVIVSNTCRHLTNRFYTTDIKHVGSVENDLVNKGVSEMNTKVNIVSETIRSES